MRRRSPSYSPPPRRGRGRSRSPSPRERYAVRREPPTSLLVRNLPKSCRAEDLRAPFKRFGPLRDVYLPKDYYTGEPRGFGFVQFLDPLDAEEAQYHMNHQIIYGRELTVIFAEENRKKPAEMRSKERLRSRGFSEEDGRPYYSRRGRSSIRSRSRSRSPPRWDRYSRFSHDYSPPESPVRSLSPERHEPKSRRHEGGSSGSERRKYVDRSPSGSPLSPSGRYAHKSSKLENRSDSRREAKQSSRRGGRHRSPSRSDGSLAERCSRSPPRSISPQRQKSPSGSDGSLDERSTPRPFPPKGGHSSHHSKSPSQEYE